MTSSNTTTVDSCVEAFDKAVFQAVNKERMKDYGHPLEHFAISAAIKKAVQSCEDPELRHALEMIADKMARLCHKPTHLDSWIDIAGYARTAMLVMDRRKEYTSSLRKSTPETSDDIKL